MLPSKGQKWYGSCLVCKSEGTEIGNLKGSGSGQTNSASETSGSMVALHKEMRVVGKLVQMSAKDLKLENHFVSLFFFPPLKYCVCVCVYV